MANKRTSKSKKTSKSAENLVSFSIEPGTKMQITVEAGELNEGKIPINIRIEEAQPEGDVQVEDVAHLKKEPNNKPPTLNPDPGFFRAHFKTYDLAKWLFIGAVILYLAVRLIGLTKFPIYFFTDEAIQTQSMVDLIENDYLGVNDIKFPTYFRNGDYMNLSLSVYLQWLPYLLFGKSAFVTRATSVFITLIAAVSAGVILRDVFKAKYWWAGTLFLSITPAWFLHSRTAFETAEFTAFFAGTLCAYLLYRYKSPRYFFLALFLGALAFYTYSPAQLIMPVFAIALLISDWRYHWENRSILLIGLVAGVILALPYIRFRLDFPDAPESQLFILGSYLTSELSLLQKALHYLSEYLVGLTPWYWYQPNDRTLERHLMKGYGNIMVATLPFAILGMAHVLRNLRESSHRTILLAVLVTPVSAALVQIGITRVLIFVVPAAILTALGLERFLQWIASPRERIAELGDGIAPTRRRIITGLLVLFAGGVIAYFAKETIDRVSVIMLALILGLQISGTPSRFSQWLVKTPATKNLDQWHVSQPVLTFAVFGILAGVNVFMLTDALRNGPLWYSDYGMGGMQYGAFQMFDIVTEYQEAHPDTTIIFSPSWANGTDVIARFFMEDAESVSLGSIESYVRQKLPLDDTTLFIMIPSEYDFALQNDKFSDIRVEKIIPFPDGAPGFYFVRLRYSQAAEDIFTAEKAARDALQETNLIIDGQDVKVSFSYLESGTQAESIALVFDGSPYTLAKTYESNPFIVELTFPSNRTVNGFSIIIGATNARITVKGYADQESQPVVYTFEGIGTSDAPELSFDLPDSLDVRTLEFEVLIPNILPPTNVHIWEIILR